MTVAWGGYSGSHQVWVSDVHQVNSDLAPVLSLRPLLQWGGISGSHQNGIHVHQTNSDSDLAMYGEGSAKGQLRLSLQPLPWSQVTQISFCLYVSAHLHAQALPEFWVFKNDHNMGPDWLPLKEPLTVHEFSGAGSQGVVRLGQMELIAVMQI